MSRRSSAPGPRQARRARGRRGEDLAETYLRRLGFRILARNLHLRHAEIDLLALDGDALCLVEVRLRSADDFGTAEESVDARKQRRLVRAASLLLARGDLPSHSHLRFDVVAVDASRKPARVRLIRDAFRADGR